MIPNVLSGTENDEKQKKTLYKRCWTLDATKFQICASFDTKDEYQQFYRTFRSPSPKSSQKGPSVWVLNAPQSANNPRHFQYRFLCNSQRFRLVNFKIISLGLFKEKVVLPRKTLSKGQNLSPKDLFMVFLSLVYLLLLNRTDLLIKVYDIDKIKLTK